MTLSPPRVFAAVLALTLLVPLPAVFAQQQPTGPGLPQPVLHYLTPAGGQAGTAVEVTLTGNDLDLATGLLFSHPAVKAAPLGPATLTAAAPNPGMGRRGQQGRAPLVATRFKVTIPRDVPASSLDVRVVSKWGVSNPRAFIVGDLPEAVEKDPNNDVSEAQVIPLNSTVHGTIAQPTDVDYYRLRGTKGQRVVVHCQATSIDSRLNAAIEVYSAAGSLLGAGRHYQNGDALVDVVLPDDEDCLIRVFSFAYQQGGTEYFYRLTASIAPWIDAVFPAVVEPGKKTMVTVYGRNLPGGVPDPTAVVQGRILEKITTTITAPSGPAVERLAYSGHVPPPTAFVDGFEFRLRNDTGASNPFLLTYARAPLVLDPGTNDTPETAQAVSVPCEIAGRIEKRRDRDWYSFTARKGTVLSIELYGDRLGAPVDLYAVLRNGRTKQTITELDDNPEQTPNQFFHRSDDPARYRFSVPDDGTYLLQVSSRESDVEASPRHVYRVRITPEQPDFRLVVMPASPTAPDAAVVHRSASQYFAVFVSRMDGFDGEIALRAEGLPKGVSCPPQKIAAGQRQGVLVVSASADAALGHAELRVKGAATIAGKSIEREARPATITWPLPQNQNIPAVSRLDRSLALTVAEPGPFSLTANLGQATVRPGEKLSIPVKVLRNWSDFKGPIQLTALGISQGQNPPAQTVPAEKGDFTFSLDVRPNTPPGVYTVVLRGQAQVPFSRDGSGKQKQNVNVSLPATPVIVTVEARRR